MIPAMGTPKYIGLAGLSSPLMTALKRPHQQRKRKNSAAHGYRAPGSQARQAPPHDQAGRNPDDDADAGHIYKQAPELVAESGLTVAAAEMHPLRHLRPAHGLALGLQLLVFGRVGESDRVAKTEALDVQRVGFRFVRPERAFQIG